MQCPHCPGVTLVMTERQGVEIDYCPQCRGVWLDRGELDKLLERASAQPTQVAQQPVARSAPSYSPRRDFEDSDFGKHRGYPAKRHKSWLSEIFD